MSQDTRSAVDSAPKAASIDRVEAYRLALVASVAAWEDGSLLKVEPLLSSIAPQLVRACGSMSANIAEGYARRSKRDRIRFYEYALGSAEEARTWYEVSKPALKGEVVAERVATLTSIRRLLLVMIRNERQRTSWNATRTSDGAGDDT